MFILISNCKKFKSNFSIKISIKKIIKVSLCFIW